jgi:hypothetical protein
MSVRHLRPIVVNNVNHPMLWIAFTLDLTSRTPAKEVRMVSETVEGTPVLCEVVH